MEHESKFRLPFRENALTWRMLLYAVLLLAVCAGTTGLVYRVPWVYERTFWRIEVLRGRVRDIVAPPNQVLPTPDAAVAAMVQATLTAIVPPSATPGTTALPGPTGTDDPTFLPTASPFPTATPTPLPNSISLAGVTHEYQKWNNCGPATLAMDLSFWGWEGTQSDTAIVLKPDQKDANVMADEMVMYVGENTALRALYRVGGDFEIVKRLIAQGFPVILEKGFWVSEEKGWMGHYTLLTGYDDFAGAFTAQDSYEGPNYLRDYDQLLADWRAFNYLFVVSYPPDREAELLALLGPLADDFTASQIAAERAQQETNTSEGQALAFAWFNLGTSLNALGDYAGAAAAYDQARLVGLPWRMLWYQTGPYRAYFSTARYQDVIDLTTATLASMDNLEESYYWRGLAYQAQGRQDAAITDWKRSLDFNPNFGPGAYQLDLLGVSH